MERTSTPAMTVKNIHVKCLPCERNSSAFTIFHLFTVRVWEVFKLTHLYTKFITEMLKNQQCKHISIAAAAAAAAKSRVLYMWKSIDFRCKSQPCNKKMKIHN